MLYRFEDYELDTDRFELRRAGKATHLEPQVFEVLSYLVGNAGRMVPKQELLDHVWPESYIGEAALNSRVMAARKAVGDTGREQRLIKTVHGRGFRFVGPIQSDALAATPDAAPGSPATQVRMPTAADVPGLSPPTTSFVGRSGELARLGELLSLPAVRLLTIAGPGGVGKTRLAMEAARQQATAGVAVAFVPLENSASVSDVACAVAGVLGLTLGGEGSVADLAQRLQGTSRLLILDNFEHLAREGGPMISEVLRSCPDARVVVTSRVVLGLQEEWLVPISGLLFEGGASSEAEQLFRERQSQRSGLTDSDDGDAAGVEAICRLVEGMPLAIELAASLTRYLPAAEVAEQIRQDAGVLRADLRNVPARHRSVSGLLAESVRNLTVEQVQALLSFGVFEGSFDVRAAEAVAGATAPIIGALVDRSLVQPRGGRFALHALTRQHVREQLGEALEPLRAVHGRYYLDMVTGLRSGLEGAAQLESTDAIQADRGNILAAWRWAAEGGEIELLGAAAYPLFLYTQFRARFVEGGDLFSAGIAAAEARGERAASVAADLFALRAWSWVRRGRGGHSLDDIRRAGAIRTAHRLPLPSGMALDQRTALAMLNWGTGTYERCYELAAAAASDAATRHDEMGQAFALWLAASARLRTVTLDVTPARNRRRDYNPRPGSGGEELLAEAGSLIDTAASILERRGERWLRSDIEIERGLQATAHGQRERAIEHHRLAYRLRRDLGDSAGMGSALIYLADEWLGIGDLDAASKVHEEAAVLIRSLGDQVALSELERTMAAVPLARGHYPEAAALLESALRRALELGFNNQIVSALRSVAEILLECGDAPMAAWLANVIASHPSTTPFTRALAEALKSELAGSLDAGQAADAARNASESPLDAVAARAVAALVRTSDPRGNPLLVSPQ